MEEKFAGWREQVVRTGRAIVRMKADTELTGSVSQDCSTEVIAVPTENQTMQDGK